MAILDPGQIGNFSGKVGRVVISPWKGLTVGRSVPKKSSKVATEVQLNQRSKFGLVTTFVSRFGDLIPLGYQSVKGNVSPYNIAVQYHLKNAVTGIYPDYSIDFTKVRLSAPKGANEIDGISTITTGAAVNYKVALAWELKQSQKPSSKDTDLLYVVFFNATEDNFMTYDGVAERSELTANLRLPQENITDVIHGWMFFVSADKKMVSHTKYLGIMKLSAA